MTEKTYLNGLDWETFKERGERNTEIGERLFQEYKDSDLHYKGTKEVLAEIVTRVRGNFFADDILVLLSIVFPERKHRFVRPVVNGKGIDTGVVSMGLKRMFRSGKLQGIRGEGRGGRNEYWTHKLIPGENLFKLHYQEKV